MGQLGRIHGVRLRIDPGEPQSLAEFWPVQAPSSDLLTAVFEVRQAAGVLTGQAEQTDRQPSSPRRLLDERVGLTVLIESRRGCRDLAIRVVGFGIQRWLE